jgi:hypothetical protein
MREEPLLEAVHHGHLVSCHRKRDMQKLVADKFGKKRIGGRA